MPKGFEHADLAGELVNLCPIRAEDAEGAFPLLQDDRIISRLFWDGLTGLEELSEGYRQRAEWFGTGEQFDFAIGGHSSAGLIGSIDLTFPRPPLQAEIRYWLRVPFWGRGYMSDTIRLATYFAFQHLDAARGHARGFLANHAIRRVLEKNCSQLDGRLWAHILKLGVLPDFWFLTLLRGEWERARDRFLPREERILTLAISLNVLARRRSLHIAPGTWYNERVL